MTLIDSLGLLFSRRGREPIFTDLSHSLCLSNPLMDRRSLITTSLFVFLLVIVSWTPVTTCAQRGNAVKLLGELREATRNASDFTLMEGGEISVPKPGDDEEQSLFDDYGGLVLDPCSPEACTAHFTSYATRPLEIPCSVASGEMGEQPLLPLVYAGDYSFCASLDFAKAHFCTIETGVLVLPLLDATSEFKDEVLPLGALHIGKCVSKQCTAKLLRRRFLSGAKDIASRIARRLDLKAASYGTNVLARRV